jgi:ABC-type glutathione transport system ATPase component
VAEKAVKNASDAAIIPLGESGSGKSCNIQMILHYLALRYNAEKSLKDDMMAVSCYRVSDLTSITLLPCTKTKRN